MRNYMIELTLVNGLSFRGVVSATSYRAAKETVWVDVPRRTIQRMEVTEV